MAEAKKIAAKVKMVIMGGQATPAPPGNDLRRQDNELCD